MTNSRRKGKDSENELARLLSEQLGIAIKRNLAQVRDAGADLALPGWSLEVKRAARPRLTEWWQQTLTQAEAAGTRPALAYRLDRQPWRFVVCLRDLADNLSEQPDHLTAELGLLEFSLLVRESVDCRLLTATVRKIPPCPKTRTT